jgi:hypothetical protein
LLASFYLFYHIDLPLWYSSIKLRRESTLTAIASLSISLHDSFSSYVFWGHIIGLE